MQIGTSVEGRPITAFIFEHPSTRTAKREILFVGGIHGGYEWNSVLLAYRTIAYLKSHRDALPDTVRVVIIPSLNPDGVFAVTKKEGEFAAEDVHVEYANGEGRLNANGVDLNRNFGCKWSKNAQWRGKSVGAGENAFSEPESQALRDYVALHHPVAVVFWHSQANAVYASECHNGVLPKTEEIMNAYAKSAGYTAVESFTAYPVTGDAEGWLASLEIPAITVELSTHEDIEWDKNRRGIDALIAHMK